MFCVKLTLRRLVIVSHGISSLTFLRKEALIENGLNTYHLSCAQPAHPLSSTSTCPADGFVIGEALSKATLCCPCSLFLWLTPLIESLELLEMKGSSLELDPLISLGTFSVSSS